MARIASEAVVYASALGVSLGIYLLVLGKVAKPKSGTGGPRVSRGAKRPGTYSGIVAESASSYERRPPGGSPGEPRRFAVQAKWDGLVATAWALVSGAAVGSVSFALSGIPALGLVGAALGAVLPALLVRAKERKRAMLLRSLWPDACRHLVANLQVGDSLPHALGSLGSSGPAELRPYFARFARRYSATGDFESSLEALRGELAFCGLDRQLATLRLAHRSGGTALVSVLKMAAELAAERIATERELRARQSWAVTAARVSAAAPWAILLLLSMKPATAGVYATPLGTKVILGGAVATAMGYGLMLRIGRVPTI